MHTQMMLHHHHFQGETAVLAGGECQLPSTSSFRHYELETVPSSFCPPPSSLTFPQHPSSHPHPQHPSSSSSSSSSSSPAHQNPFLHLQQYRQAHPLPPSTSQPRFQQSLIPSPSSRRSSSPSSSPSKKQPKRLGGRSPSPSSDDEASARFVSPLSVEPRLRHLTRQKLMNNYLSAIPDSLVVQSSCNLHSYKVEAEETRERVVLESLHNTAAITVVVREQLDSSSPPSSYFDDDFFNSSEEDDPVICASPLLYDGYHSDSGSSSRSRSPDFSDDLPSSASLLERLNHLEMIIGSNH